MKAISRLFLLLVLNSSIIAAPSFNQIKAAYRSSEAQVLDRNGKILQEVRLDLEGRRLGWVPLNGVSHSLISAVVFSEDKRFYTHSGADLVALSNAALHYLFSKSRRGASTITMQVASQLDPELEAGSGGRTFAQKLKQIRAARDLESSWTKDQILETYLNLITFRGELRGIASASYALFGRDPHALSEIESVILASLIRSPRANTNALTKRSCTLAYFMKIQTDCGTVASAVTQVLSGRVSVKPLADHAPHLPGLIIHKLGHMPYETKTTLDLQTQEAAVEILHKHLISVRDRNVRDGAMLVIDNSTHSIVAYVGSSGELSAAPLVDSIRSRRQAGSALKPFLYAAAIDRKLITASTLIDDTPMNVQADRGIYRPENYDKDFLGPVTARIALASSRNIPAVRLVEIVGVPQFVLKLEQLGFDEMETPEFYGPSIALGSADISLWDITSAYSALANDGLFQEPHFLVEQKENTAGIRAYSRETSFIVSDILSDRESRSPTFGLENVLATPFWSAVKTGTSKDMRDNWCVGYTKQYTVGVWVGNASGEPMWNVLGVTGAAPVWIEMMKFLNGNQSRNPAMPPDVVAEKTSYGTEYYIRGTEGSTSGVDEAAAEGIIYPAPESIFAIDPEIPSSRQRIFFRGSSPNKKTTWLLNGKKIGNTNPLPWKPVAGKFRLKLIQECAGCKPAVSELQFVVR